MGTEWAECGEQRKEGCHTTCELNPNNIALKVILRLIFQITKQLMAIRISRNFELRHAYKYKIRYSDTKNANLKHRNGCYFLLGESYYGLQTESSGCGILSH